MAQLSRQAFHSVETICALRVPRQQVAALMQAGLKKAMLRRSKLKPIVADPDDDGRRLLLLEKGQTLESLGATQREAVREAGGEAIEYNLELGYENYSYEEVLRRIIPDEIDVPTSFENVGHIVHFNLRDSQLPYRHVIGEVIQDKVHNARTVVNKLSRIDNVHRNFEMELLAGEADYVATVRESGCRFQFDFSKVYWNSRLHTEHERLVRMFSCDDVVCDVFAGIGPFAVPAAKKGCLVYANDLNPHSYSALVENAKTNKVSAKVRAHNLDGRDFIREIAAQKLPSPITQVVMNLPAIAVEFLDAFRGVFPRTTPLPTIHCYAFSSAEDPLEDILARADTALGIRVDRETVSMHDVRDVAPRKHMYCISFPLPEVVAYQESGAKRKEPE